MDGASGHRGARPPNVVPGAYRGVSVAQVESLDPDRLRGHFLGREAYRRTRWIVVRHGDATALIEVARADPHPLFSPIVDLTILATPAETCWIERPDIDTAVPSQLAKATLEPDAAGARCVVVHGRYGHVSFLLDPHPVHIRVREVVPPEPAKLLDQAQRLLDVAEDLPPILLEVEDFDLADVVPATGSVLLPCRGGEITLDGRDTWYLDEHPVRQPWTLLGCARSREIHRWFYRDEPDASVDLCPRHLPRRGDGPLLTKCCLLETDLHLEPGLAVVPWGATLDQIGIALAALAKEVEPVWALA